jgi:hypothetical protein
MRSASVAQADSLQLRQVVQKAILNYTYAQKYYK